MYVFKGCLLFSHANIRNIYEIRWFLAVFLSIFYYLCSHETRYEKTICGMDLAGPVLDHALFVFRTHTSFFRADRHTLCRMHPPSATSQPLIQRNNQHSRLYTLSGLPPDIPVCNSTLYSIQAPEILPYTAGLYFTAQGVCQTARHSPSATLCLRIF